MKRINQLITDSDKDMERNPVARSFEQLVSNDIKAHPLIQQMRAVPVPHRRFDDLLMAAAGRFMSAPDEDITAIIGATTAGKTRLVEELCRHVQAAADKLDQSPPKRIVKLSLVAPLSRSFDFDKDFLRPVLQAFSPFPTTKKVSLEAIKVAEKVRTRNLVPTKQDIEVEVLEKFEQFNVIGVLVDNAHYLRIAASGRAALDNYDTLTSFSNRTRAHFLLVATSRLKDILGHHAEVGRRILHFPFHGYGAEEGEYACFAQAAKWLYDRCPIRCTYSLDEKLELLFYGCLGLIGGLYLWFERAVATALMGGKKEISWKLMASVAMTLIQRNSIERELVEFSDYLSSLEEPSGDKQDKAQPRTGRKPGEPNPKRFPVGLQL